MQRLINDYVMTDHFSELFIKVAPKLKQPLKFSNFEKLNTFINSKVTDDVPIDMPLIICSFEFFFHR